MKIVWEGKAKEYHVKQALCGVGAETVVLKSIDFEELSKMKGVELEAWVSRLLMRFPA